MTKINILKQMKRKPRVPAPFTPVPCLSVAGRVCAGLLPPGPGEWTGGRDPQRELWTLGSPFRSEPLL